MVLPGQVPALLSPLPQADGMSEGGKGTLTTHVLNTATGLPAAGLGIRLAQLQEPGLQWMELAHRYESWWHLSGAGTLLPGLCELGQRLLAQGSAQPSPGVCLLVAGQVLGWGRAVFWGTAGLPWSGFRHTDADGRCQPLLAAGQAKAGTYKLHFETAEYWQGLGHTSFYPFVEVRRVGRLGQVTQHV